MLVSIAKLNVKQTRDSNLEDTWKIQARNDPKKLAHYFFIYGGDGVR